MLLKNLHQNVGQLKGLGAKACSNLLRLGITQISQLLQHYPSRYLDHREPQTLEQEYCSASGGYCYALVQVVEHSYIPWSRSGWQGTGGYRQDRLHPGQALKLLVRDASGREASLLCFGRNFLAGQLPEGSYLFVGGKFQLRYGELQCSSFAHEAVANPAQPYKKALALESASYNASEFGCILPIYPLSQGLSQKSLRSAIAQALQHFSFSLEDEIPQAFQNKYQLLEKKDAVRQIHFPVDKEELARAHDTLVYEELLLLMLLIQRRRLQQHKELQCHTFQNLELQDHLLQQARSALPFKLSGGQEDALQEILVSFRQSIPMNRLLQGDVGSGKTIVALLSVLPWLEAGAQVVLMAPTEILARQLHRSFTDLCRTVQEHAELPDTGMEWEESLNRSAFLASSVTGAKRQEILRQLRSGELYLLVGTHALFSQAVEFAKLRYIIVDEQHRFGVEQRLALKHKALQPPHILLMSATPIPRTLALTLYGDLDISTIHSMPNQRKGVQTHLVRQGNDQKMYDFIQKQLQKGHQAYFIYPLIGEDVGLRSVEQMEDELRRVFAAYQLGTVHGQMKQDAKDAAMNAFRQNELQILLATTVLEVGIDVANATVVVVEHAERFGLAQLHQLRGRVGRSCAQGYCFLVYEADKALSPLAKERLLTLKDSSDGFAIAEKDLELRGTGDLLGTEQSGNMDLHIARIPEDLEWLERAKSDAAELLQQDYTLLQHPTLRQVLLGQEGLNA